MPVLTTVGDLLPRWSSRACAESYSARPPSPCLLARSLLTACLPSLPSQQLAYPLPALPCFAYLALQCPLDTYVHFEQRMHVSCHCTLMPLTRFPALPCLALQRLPDTAGYPQAPHVCGRRLDVDAAVWQVGVCQVASRIVAARPCSIRFAACCCAGAGWWEAGGRRELHIC